MENIVTSAINLPSFSCSSRSYTCNVLPVSTCRILSINISLCHVYCFFFLLFVLFGVTPEIYSHTQTERTEIYCQLNKDTVVFKGNYAT